MPFGKRNDGRNWTVPLAKALTACNKLSGQLQCTGPHFNCNSAPPTPFREQKQSFCNHAAMDRKGLAVRNEDKNNKQSIKKSADYILPHWLGKCDWECAGCGALHWTQEAIQADLGKAKIMFSTCCQENKVALPSFDKSAPAFPSELQALFDGTDEGEPVVEAGN